MDMMDGASTHFLLHSYVMGITFTKKIQLEKFGVRARVSLLINRVGTATHSLGAFNLPLH